MKYKYPVAFSSWGPEEQVAIAQVHYSGRYTMDQEVKLFEHELATYYGRRYAIACNSGSSANLLAVAALFNKQEKPLKQGDKVIVPAVAWSTTYGPCIQHKLDLIIFDCDKSWNAPIVSDVEKARLAIGCSILGNPTYLTAWQQHSLQNIYFINDDCEAFGAQDSNGCLTGTFGLMSTGSGFYSHQLSAIELGWVLTDNDELANLCRLLRNHGNDGWNSPDFDTSYNFVLFGYNLRPLEMHAAIARVQLQKQDEFAKQRRRNWRMFADMSRGIPIQMQEMRGNPNPFGIAFTCESNEARAKLVKALRSAGIDSRLPTGGSFLKHPYGAPWRDQKTPNADRIHDTGMFLGCAPFPIDEKIESAIRVMRKALL